MVPSDNGSDSSDRSLQESAPVLEQDEARDAAESSEYEENDALATRLASPIDRLAALVADLVVFLPLMAVGMAPFRRAALVAQLMNHESDWAFALASAVGIAVISAILYQTTFVALWGATPGKRILGLRVVSIWDGERPRPMAAFLRSILWCFELALIGVPWIAVFANERRRPLHDRAADTAVITVSKKKAAGLPSLPEMSLASGAYAAVLASLAIVAVVSIHRLKSENASAAKLVSEMEEKGLLCEAVGEAKDEWLSATGAENPPRMAIALALYGADAVDATCLEQEADFAIWREQSRGLAYLAKGLAKEDDSEARDSYFEKACGEDPSGDPCKLVHLIQLSEEFAQESESAEEKVDQVAAENEIQAIIEYARNGGPHYLRVWAVRDLMEAREYGRALDMCEDPAPHRSIGYFFARERAKALWGVDRKSEARIAMRSAIDTMDPVNRVALSSWFCFNETVEGSCGADGRWACDVLASAVEKEEQWLASEDIAATYVRGHSCRSESDPRMLSGLEEKIPEQDGRLFVQALLELRADHRAKAIELLKSVGRESEDRGRFYFEAASKLTELAARTEDLEPILAQWNRTAPSDGWTALGKRLMSRFQDFKRWERSLEIGLRLVETERFDRQTYRSIVVSAYRSGQKQIALGFLENLARMDEVEFSRSPAGMSDFDDVMSELSSNSRGGRR